MRSLSAVDPELELMCTLLFEIKIGNIQVFLRGLEQIRTIMHNNSLNSARQFTPSRGRHWAAPPPTRALPMNFNVRIRIPARCTRCIFKFSTTSHPNRTSQAVHTVLHLYDTSMDFLNYLWTWLRDLGSPLAKAQTTSIAFQAKEYHLVTHRWIRSVSPRSHRHHCNSYRYHHHIRNSDFEISFDGGEQQ